MALWKKMDWMEGMPVYLEPTDQCFFAREYTSHKDYKFSEANDLISNLKKKPDRKGKPEWKWKLHAIEKFAQELKVGLKPGHALVAIPPSRVIGDPEYDSRIDDVVARAAELVPGVLVERPLRLRENRQSLRLGGARKIEAIYRSLEWVGFKQLPACVILVDDAITCGTNFKACQRHILEHHPTLPVYGTFWGKLVWDHSTPPVTTPENPISD